MFIFNLFHGKKEALKEIQRTKKLKTLQKI